MIMEKGSATAGMSDSKGVSIIRNWGLSIAPNWGSVSSGISNYQVHILKNNQKIFGYTLSIANANLQNIISYCSQICDKILANC